MVTLAELQEICHSAGVDPDRVLSMEANYRTVRLIMKSVDPLGWSSYARDGKIATYWMEVQVQR